MVAADDVDAESLQAQVDMTMSFAHNLVTSWIKPSYRAQLRSSGANAISTLEEELRRPPRLGVGAFVMPSLAHEASKLQRRLGKRGADNRDALHPQDSPKSDDEERKGRPVKRKMKVDPFGHEASRKKRNPNLETDPHPSVDDSRVKHPVSPWNGSTLGPLTHTQTGPGDRRPTAYSPSGAPRENSETPVPGTTSAGPIRLHHANSMLISDEAKPIGISLLNLDGPPETTDEPGNGSQLNNGFKKKRKRRKKKNTKMMAGTGDYLH